MGRWTADWLVSRSVEELVWQAWIWQIRISQAHSQQTRLRQFDFDGYIIASSFSVTNWPLYGRCVPTYEGNGPAKFDSALSLTSYRQILCIGTNDATAGGG